MLLFLKLNKKYRCTILIYTIFHYLKHAQVMLMSIILMCTRNIRMSHHI